MANAGFSAVENYWGTIAGLTPKTSNDGKTSSVAECPDEYGDTVAHDVYGEVIAPSTEYTVTAAITAAAATVYLGKIYTAGTKKIMLTQVQVTTSANNHPQVTISGVEVESSATDKRLYAVNLALLPRAKAQDVAGAFTASSKFTAITTTFSVDQHVQTVSGVPVASDASHGRVEVQATMTDGDDTGTITAASAGGFTVTASPAETAPDANYITKAATATKYLAGTEGGTGSN